MNPPSAESAGRQAALLARKQFKRISSATLRRRVAGARMIAITIWKRWGCGIYRWRLKHVRWYLTCALSDQEQSTKYQYWLVLRSLLKTINKERWLPSLVGDWCKPKRLADKESENRKNQIGSVD